MTIVNNNVAIQMLSFITETEIRSELFERPDQN